MKIWIAASVLLAIGTAAASAQMRPYDRGLYPYESRHHAVCQEKARRLHDYERRSARDGRIDHREREIIRSLERDLDRDCGRYRFRG